jgi:coproporphyrinogen III oxidase
MTNAQCKQTWQAMSDNMHIISVHGDIFQELFHFVTQKVTPLDILDKLDAVEFITTAVSLLHPLMPMVPIKHTEMQIRVNQ